LNKPLDSQPATEEVLYLPAKSTTFCEFPQDEGGPKKAEKDPDNLEKPDRVRSAE
jgi:hypothetical protein